MKRRIFLLLLIIVMISIPVNATTIRWVNFDIPYESLKLASDTDIDTFDKEKHIDWIDILAVAACRTGGKCPVQSVKKAIKDLQGDRSAEEILGDLYRLYPYYHDAYEAVLGGMIGSYSIKINGDWKPAYGIKAYSPIAAGYGYSHCSDFGNQRSFGFARKHLGNDLMGAQGTPIIAVEGGVVEAMGWNRYGGWRIVVLSYHSI